VVAAARVPDDPSRPLACLLRAWRAAFLGLNRRLDLALADRNLAHLLAGRSLDHDAAEPLRQLADALGADPARSSEARTLREKADALTRR
jgi:hypothetical protein